LLSKSTKDRFTTNCTISKNGKKCNGNNHLWFLFKERYTQRDKVLTLKNQSGLL
jgi:hypothetical protein